MKILIIGPFPNPITGLSIANQKLYENLIQKGYKVSTINTELSDSTQAQGKLSLKKLLFISYYFQSWKIFNTSIVYMTPGQTFFGVLKYAPYLLVSKLFQKKTIFHLHGNYLRKEYDSLQGIKKTIFRRIIQAFDQAIILSPSLTLNFDLFLPKENIHIVPNFYDKELKLSHEEFLKKSFQSLKLLFMSNLIEEKGINNLLRALQILEETNIHINLTIAGHKMTDNNIEPFFSKNIKYIGVVKGKEKRKILLESNLFCLPTYYEMEGQPISMIEAMATGNAILTCKHAGIPDICNENNAIFVKKNSVDSIVEQLRYLYHNNSVIHQLAQENLQYSHQFSEEIFTENIIKIFNKCLN